MRVHGERIIDALAGPGYIVIPSAAGRDFSSGLLGAALQREADGLFRPAAIGGGQQRIVRPDIRGDEISWIEEPLNTAELRLLRALDDIRVTCNRALMLGLEALELHFAHYRSGAGYGRHHDRSPRGIERVVTVIYYLNASWVDGDGGELDLDTDDGVITVTPRADTLVLFMAERFAHTVRPAIADRRSVTGWFHRRSMPPV